MNVYALIALLCWVACGSPATKTANERDAPAAAARATPAVPSDTLRVLFIGNSYTYVNALPRLTQGLAASAPEAQALAVAMVAPGGATLERHWTSGAARRTIHSHDLGLQHEPRVLGRSDGLEQAQASVLSEEVTVL